MKRLYHYTKIITRVRRWGFTVLYAFLLSLGCAFIAAADPLNVVVIKTDDQRGGIRSGPCRLSRRN